MGFTLNCRNVSFGTVNLPCHRLRFSQIVLRVAIARIQSYGFLELGNGVVHLPLLSKNNTEVIMGFSDVGIDFQGLLVLGHYLVHLKGEKDAMVMVKVP